MEWIYENSMQYYRIIKKYMRWNLTISDITNLEFAIIRTTTVFSEVKQNLDSSLVLWTLTHNTTNIT
jgi:hypothetical protein